MHMQDHSAVLNGIFFAIIGRPTQTRNPNTALVPCFFVQILVYFNRQVVEQSDLNRFAIIVTNLIRQDLRIQRNIDLYICGHIFHVEFGELFGHSILGQIPNL